MRVVLLELAELEAEHQELITIQHLRQELLIQAVVVVVGHLTHQMVLARPEQEPQAGRALLLLDTDIVKDKHVNL
jgi:hypothetical protein